MYVDAAAEAIKVSSTKTRTSGPILSAPKTGAMPVPKAIQRLASPPCWSQYALCHIIC